MSRKEYCWWAKIPPNSDNVLQSLSFVLLSHPDSSLSSLFGHKTDFSQREKVGGLQSSLTVPRRA